MLFESYFSPQTDRPRLILFNIYVASSYIYIHTQNITVCQFFYIIYHNIIYMQQLQPTVCIFSYICLYVCMYICIMRGFFIPKTLCKLREKNHTYTIYI